MRWILTARCAGPARRLLCKLRAGSAKFVLAAVLCAPAILVLDAGATSATVATSPASMLAAGQGGGAADGWSLLGLALLVCLLTAIAKSNHKSD